MPHIKRRELKKTKIEIIPMIDTMFFLLVFFILASLNVIDMKGAQVRLPTSTNQDRQAIAQVTVTIKESGDMIINKTFNAKNVDELQGIIVQELNGKKDSNNLPLTPENAILVINADRKTRYSYVRDCIDAARRVKFRKFSIATDPKFGKD